MTTVLVLGFLIGMRHALDSDHVAAVASVVVSAKSVGSGIRHGIVWGLGHTLTLFAVGSFVVLADTAVSPAIAQLLEFCVGFMLVALGIDVARTMIRDRIHFHVHEHEGGKRHVHAHRHRAKAIHNAESHQHAHVRAFPRRTLFIGLMHGLAGSAALMILAIDGSKSISEGLLFIAVFGVGSIAGMALLSAAITIPLRHSARHLVRFHRAAQAFVAIANVSLGTILMSDIATLLP